MFQLPEASQFGDVKFPPLTGGHREERLVRLEGMFFEERKKPVSRSVETNPPISLAHFWGVFASPKRRVRLGKNAKHMKIQTAKF